MTIALCFLFFLSGTAALVFENLWFHQASLAFGNSVWASSLVLAAFMAGLGLGNGAAARFGPRLRNPVASYARLEVVIGVTGLALVWGLPMLAPALAPVLRPLMDVPWLLHSARLVLTFALLLIPASAMGATLPLLVRALSGADPHFGRVLGRLYGWNTLGAVFGAVACEAFLIDRLGVRGSGLVAALLNGTAGLVAAGIARRQPVAGATGTPASPGVALTAPARRTLLAVAMSGFALLAFEVVWFRFLLLFLAGTSLAFALMLAVVLTGIALGGLFAGGWLRRAPEATRHLSSLAWTGGILAVAAYASFSQAYGWVKPHYLMDWPDVVLLGTWLMFPVSFVSGIFFTVAGTLIQQQLGSEIRATGLLTLANTVGAALGSLVAGFLLLPWLGMETSFLGLSALYALTGLVVLRGVDAPSPRVTRWATGLVLMLALVAFPRGLMEHHYLKRVGERLTGPLGRIVAVREGLTETIQYSQSDLFGEPLFHGLITNGFSMAGSHQATRRYMKLYVYWPVAVHPAPRNALLVSYGVGQTAKALTDTRELETIDIVDISEDVLELNSIVYPDPAELPLSDPRVRVHIEDGRYFLQTTERRFDLITGEPPPPRMAGVVNLYTREYFELMHERLAPGGIATYWLPVRALSDWDTRVITRAFCDAFEDCSLWLGATLDWMLVGTRGLDGPAPMSRFTRQWQDPTVREEMVAVGIEIPEQLGATFLADADQLEALTRGYPPLTDDWPKRLRRRSWRDRPGVREPLRIWMDSDAARERFRDSEFIRGLWPPELREASLGYFDTQRIINERLLPDATSEAPVLPVLHRVLEETSLRTLPLWLMDSGARQQAIAERATERGMRGPFLSHLLGVGELADRRFDEAARHFAQALERKPDLSPTGWLHAYALCRRGSVADDGEASKARIRGEVKPGDLAEWRWLEEHCANERREPR